jgi:transposase InsO family protein
MDPDERLALFRAMIIGELATRELDHGELMGGLRELSCKRFRPPDTDVTRSYSIPTLQRWLYAYRKSGIDGLKRIRRSDAGRAQALSAKIRQLLIDIREDYPSASVPLILRTLDLAGTLPAETVSVQTVRRLLREAGMPRLARGARDSDVAEVRQRLRWVAPYTFYLWHADVCHALRIEIGNERIAALVHAILDDHSRYLVRLEVRATEREQDMLEIFAAAVREHGIGPERLYTDGGATYTGSVLPIVCERLGTHLLHPAPRDPQARGKGERVFRTMREQCIDHIRGASSLHDVFVRLLAWREQYHKTAHSGLMGRTPEQVWSEGLARLGHQEKSPISEDQLRDAYLIESTRRVNKDSCLSVDGKLYEVDAAWLGGRKVTLVRSFLAPTEPYLLFENQRYPLIPCDPSRNANRGRKPAKRRKETRATLDFQPADEPLRHLLGNPDDKEKK